MMYVTGQNLPVHDIVLPVLSQETYIVVTVFRLRSSEYGYTTNLRNIYLRFS